MRALCPCFPALPLTLLQAGVKVIGGRPRFRILLRVEDRKHYESLTLALRARLDAGTVAVFGRN